MIDSKNTKIPLKVNAIVTHAHSDHFAAMNSYSTTFATQATIDLFNKIKKTKTRSNFISVEFNEQLKLQPDSPDVKISFIPSGHILGSASVFIENDNSRFLFSGDVGGKGQLTSLAPLKAVQADILVVEATFGSPELVFPSREETSMEILKWSANVIKEKKNVLFSAGRLGSSQELIKLFNNLTNLNVITHGEVTQLSEIYQKHGVKLVFHDSKSEEGKEILRNGEAIIIQPRGKKIVPYFITEHVECKTAIVTGMASRFQYRNYDASFPLSSHANFHELIEYIKEVSPELVFTIYGLEKKLAKAITRELDIPAIPLKDKTPNAIQKTSDKIAVEQNQRKNLEREKVTLKKIERKVVSKEKKEITLDDFFKKDS